MFKWHFCNVCSPVKQIFTHFKFKLEPDGTEVELVPGFRVIVLRKAKMQLFHN